MYRFYEPKALAGAGLQSLVELDSDQSHHARRVLRLVAGDRVEVLDGKGRTAIAELMDYQRDHAQLRVIELQDHAPAKPRITLAVALPKGSRGDDMVNQLSQAGADRLIPLRTRRSVTDFSDHRRMRFERIIIESARQCGRMRLLEVEEEWDLRSVLREEIALRLMASPEVESTSRMQIEQRLQQADSVLVLIGPEGGWTDDELALAREAGCLNWCLGPHVLRIETAAVAAVSILRYWTLG